MDRWIGEVAPDVVMLQEVRCAPDQLPADWAPPPGFTPHWHAAVKKGWSGVATWSTRPMAVIGTGMDEPDPDGRILRVEVGGVQFVNVYLPSGSAGPDR